METDAVVVELRWSEIAGEEDRPDQFQDIDQGVARGKTLFPIHSRFGSGQPVARRAKRLHDLRQDLFIKALRYGFLLVVTCSFFHFKTFGLYGALYA
jgi:hypothetical protein